MHDTLSALVERAITGNRRPLEFYLREHSNLPGLHANLELADDVGYLLRAALTHNAEGVYALLRDFAYRDRKAVASNSPSEFILLCGIIAYSTCAAVKTEWRAELFELLAQLARSSHRRVRESVIQSYQHLLSADLSDTVIQLKALMLKGTYLQQCTAVITLAEPYLLYSSELLASALEFQRLALENIRCASFEDRKREAFRQLRRALGFTISVITASAPDKGFALMRECAEWNDPDVTWILRENLKTKRLARFVQDTAMLSRLLT